MLELVERKLKDDFAGSVDPRVLRLKLMVSELAEVAKALAELDEVGLADGLADLAYVTEGTAVMFSVPLEMVFAEVHESNMTKTPGKALASHTSDRGKGLGFRTADVSSVIARFKKVVKDALSQKTLIG